MVPNFAARASGEGRIHQIGRRMLMNWLTSASVLTLISGKVALTGRAGEERLSYSTVSLGDAFEFHNDYL